MAKFLTSIIHFDTNLSFFGGGLKDIMWDASPSCSPQRTALLQVDGVLQLLPVAFWNMNQVIRKADDMQHSITTTYLKPSQSVGD